MGRFFDFVVILSIKIKDTMSFEMSLVEMALFLIGEKERLIDSSVISLNGAIRKYQIPNPKFGSRGPNLGFGIWDLGFGNSWSENTKSQKSTTPRSSC
jgi:hypothetical protein